jgi:hypothetical protein
LISEKVFALSGYDWGEKTEGDEGDSFPELGGGIGADKDARTAQEHLSDYHPVVSELLSAES